MSLIAYRERSDEKTQEKNYVVAAGAPASLKRKSSGSDMTCMYPYCGLSATHICPGCLKLFCSKHKDPGIHDCTAVQSLLKGLKDRPGLRERLLEIGEELPDTPSSEYLLRVVPRRTLFEELANVVHYYRSYFHEFVEKARKSPKRITKCDLIRFIYSRLAIKLVDISNKTNKAIIMDHSVMEELASGKPSCDPRLGGYAFQWWLTLEILDILSQQGYHPVIIDADKERKACIKVKDQELMIFMDSPEIQERIGVRPDILSTIDPDDLYECRILEIKLSQGALFRSLKQIHRYARIWGSWNVVVVVATPVKDASDIMVKKIIDSIAIADEETLQKHFRELVKHILSII